MERLTRVRAAIVMALFIGVLTLFSIRLYGKQVSAAESGSNNRKTFTTYTRVKAARGDILDRNGNVLVTNRASYDLVINHFVILSADGSNDWLLRLVNTCKQLGLEYNDHFPVSKNAPFAYELSEYSSTWQGYFQSYLAVVGGGLDSDIPASLLMERLRAAYKIPDTWTDEEARAVIGLRYELRLRQGNISALPTFVLMEDVDAVSLASIMELNMPGLYIEASTVRTYNTEYAAHVLGYCSAMTAQQWEYYSQLTDQVYEMDALVGQSGLEEVYEHYLHGTDGLRKDVVNVDGTIVSQTYVKGKEPKAGQNVELTIDLNIQASAEDAMAALIEALRATASEQTHVDGSDISGGAVVVMEVKTGKILACASYPTYNLATFRKDYEQLVADKTAPLFNRALQATYPPGSTYKMSVVIAGAEAGIIDRNTTITDRGVYTKYKSSGFTANCLAWTAQHATHGALTPMQALQVSCNYFFYEVGDQISLTILDTVAKNLGLGEKTGVELPEAQGTRANAESKAALYTGDDGRWYPADQIMASIGQSINRFTPIQLCTYTCTLANRGTRYQATFLNQVVSADYKELVYVNSPTILSQMQISDEAYYCYSEGMRLVATDGTAKGLFRKYPIAVAAKTGTAQHSNGANVSDNGAFVCYAPFEDPEIAVVVYGEKAGHGSTMGQIAKAVLDTYFDNPEVGDVTTGENEIS